MDGSGERRRFGRRDLEELKRFDRDEVLAALGSFDERGLGRDDFVLRAAELLDAGRVSGLEGARREGDVERVLDVVYRACLERGELQPKTLAEGPHQGKRAEDVIAHRFEFYGEVHALPEDIDWDFNPGTGHWGHDLNRFSFLGPLVRVCVGEGQERFGRKAVELMLDWVDKADFGRAFVGTPYVFGSYLNEAIHCEIWCQSLRRLLPVGMVEPLEMLRILKSLHDQVAYLEIATRDHAGNWPTIGCRGMLSVLAAFPLFRDTDRFASYCVEGLAAQIEEQVLPDGVQDELTPHYHRVVVANLVSAAGSLRGLGLGLEERTVEQLGRMLHYLQQTVMPDGSAQVAFNDSDPTSVPDISGMAKEAGLEDALVADEELGPERFPYAGVALLRQRADRGDLFLAFDGGPFGRSHQHEDKLGFWLFAYGRSFLVDPGRHLYDSSSVSYRDYLTSTRAHSTGMVDGAGQHSRGRPESWIPQEPTDLEWSVEEGEVRAAAAYDLGYGEENNIDVVHRREIVFARERLWVIFDRFEGAGEHEVELRFQFAPGEVELRGDRARTLFGDADLLLCWSASIPLGERRVEEGQEGPRGGWYSSSYGQLEPAPCVALSARGEMPVEMATLLLPYRGEEMPEVSFRREGNAAVVEAEEIGELRIESGL